MKLIDIINENDQDINEVKPSTSFLKTFSKSASAFDDSINKVLRFDKNNRIYSGKVKNGKVPINDADELRIALAAGDVTSQQLGKLYSGLLKNPSTDPDTIKFLVTDLIDDPTFIKKYAQYSDDKILRAELKKSQFSDQSIKEIMKQKSSGKFGQKRGGGKTSTSGGNTSTSGGTGTNPGTIRGGWQKFKELLNGIKSGWTWKKVLAWGAGISLSGAALWYLLTNHGDGVVPTDMPDNPPSDWAPCVQNLLDSGVGSVVTSNSGQISVLAKGDEYPQGVKIFSNGRIYDVATRRMGRWSCKQGQVQQTNENKTDIIDRIKLLTNYDSSKTLNENIISLLEQNESELANDVETMIDLLDFPVTKNNLDSAYALLKKYVDSGKSKEFLSLYQKSGFGSGDMKKSLDYVKAFNAETVQSKEKLENLLNRAMSGAVGSSQSTGSLSNLDIEWDGDQTPTTPVPTTGRMTYFSCEDWDITTKPHIIGCTSSRIREVQSCLGLNPDGKFGPKTEKALKDIESDVSKGITLEIYNKVMRACGRPEIGVSQPSTPETTTQEPTTQDTTGQEPTGQETVTSVEPVEYGETPYTAPQETGEQFYNRLLEGGLLVGSTDNRRIKYKGVALTKNDFDKLTEYLATFGFYPMKVKEKGDEKYKYVWKLSRNQ